MVTGIGLSPENSAFKETYVTLYRYPEHQQLEKRCKVLKESDFSPAIVKFGQRLIAMKVKRHLADYHPLEKYALSAVQTDCRLVEAAINGFNLCQPEEQARFGFFVALKNRSSSK